MGHAYIHTVIDDHSRVAYAEIHDDETAATAIAAHRGPSVRLAARRHQTWLQGPDGQTVTYDVYRVQQVPKGDFPTTQVYSDTEGPEIRLITCGGELNRAAGSFEDSIIVYGRMV